MARKRAATSDRVRLIRCTCCEKTFPAGHVAIYHIQHHLEQNNVQRGHYKSHQKLICKKKWRCHQRCDREFKEPRDLAVHHQKLHAKTYWVEKDGEKYRAAEKNCKEEGEKLILKLKQDNGADYSSDWLFFLAPAPSRRRKEKRPSVSVRDVNWQEFTMAFAAFLKQSGEMKDPDFVKNDNRKKRTADSHWDDETVARKALQALEDLKLAERDPNGGKRLTSQGRSDLGCIAAQTSSCPPPSSSRTWTRSSTTCTSRTLETRNSRKCLPKFGEEVNDS